jgi:hypothetical protein
MAQRQPRKQRQPDLFSPAIPAVIVPVGTRERLLPLISALLREAARQAKKETDHEDHA